MGKKSKNIGKTIKIKELNLDIIQPNHDTMNTKKQGGSKIFVIGKPGTGKSNLIASILKNKRNVIPCAQVYSETEDSNHFYSQYIPEPFIYNSLDTNAVRNSIKRQKIAMKYLNNPWSITVYDDVFSNTSVFRTPLFATIFKNGRHHKKIECFALQYAMDVLPSIRTAVDGTFILRESILKIRKILWENYASVVPTFDIFQDLMDNQELTGNHGALYFSNANNGITDSWEDNVFWYKPPLIKPFIFGSADYNDFAASRFNPNYVDPDEFDLGF
ncbi:MAG: hypothetical protein JKX76_02660 [Colwellia sp.]|nr:hypothetical protein [Colwellia sp.]